MGSLQSEIQKTLNSWELPKTKIGTGSIASKTFNFVKDHPSCTSDDVANAISIDTGRASATLLALYQKGKLGRRTYPNPNPDGKRHEVYTYWTEVENFTDKGISRKPKKVKKPSVAQRLIKELDIDVPMSEQSPHIKFAQPQEFNPQMFVQDLSLKDARAVYEVLKGYFSG